MDKLLKEKEKSSQLAVIQLTTIPIASTLPIARISTPEASTLGAITMGV